MGRKASKTSGEKPEKPMAPIPRVRAKDKRDRDSED